MSTGTECKLDEMVERQILIAVDHSDNSLRAVQFVGDFFGCYPGIKIILLTIVLEPIPEYFSTDDDHRQWHETQQKMGTELLANYQRLLIDSGFTHDSVQSSFVCRQAPSVAAIVLEEQAKLKCCTIVIGRRGISKQEEFIFGSTSSKILHEAKNCAVLVIE